MQLKLLKIQMENARDDQWIVARPTRGELIQNLLQFISFLQITQLCVE